MSTNVKTLRKQYDKLSVRERHTLLVQARVRGDESEAEAIAAASPRFTFTVPDYYGLADGCLIVQQAVEVMLYEHALSLEHMLGVGAERHGLAWALDSGLPIKYGDGDDDLAAVLNAPASLWDDLATLAGYLLLVTRQGWEQVCARRNLPVLWIFLQAPHSGLARAFDVVALMKVDRAKVQEALARLDGLAEMRGNVDSDGELITADGLAVLFEEEVERVAAEWGGLKGDT